MPWQLHINFPSFSAQVADAGSGWIAISPLAFRCTLCGMAQVASAQVVKWQHYKSVAPALKSRGSKTGIEVCVCVRMCCCLQGSAQTRMIRMIILNSMEIILPRPEA